MKVKKPVIWAGAILGGLIILPHLTLSLFSTIPDTIPNFWLFLTFPGIFLYYGIPSTTPIFIAIIAQWSVLTLLTLQLTRKIRKLGASNSQKLLTTRKKI